MNSNEGEYITCAAVWFQDGKTYPHQTVPSGIVVAGHRHHNCYVTAGQISQDLADVEHVNGFLVSDPRGRFVTRAEALPIAEAAGQLVGRKKHHPLDELDSSDLY
jgi:hypothetical protein